MIKYSCSNENRTSTLFTFCIFKYQYQWPLQFACVYIALTFTLILQIYWQKRAEIKDCRRGREHRPLNYVQCTRVTRLKQCRLADSTLVNEAPIKSVLMDQWPSIHASHLKDVSVHFDIWNNWMLINLLWNWIEHRWEYVFTSREFWQLTIEPYSIVPREQESTFHRSQPVRKLCLNNELIHYINTRFRF